MIIKKWSTQRKVKVAEEEEEEEEGIKNKSLERDCDFS
jgi:hypothetical protein